MTTQATGQQFRAIRKSIGWTQAETARHLGVTRLTVSRWELSTPPVSASIAIHTLARTFASAAKRRAEESGQI